MQVHNWAQTLPGALLAVTLLLGPGWGVLRALGVSGLVALAAAPAVSCGVLSVAGTLMALVGLSWSTPVALGIAVAGALVGVLAARRADLPRPAPRTVWPIVLGVALGALVIGLAALPAIGSPGELVDSPDAVYHLNRITTYAVTGRASLLEPVYPAGLHTFAVSLLPLVGGDAIVAVNVFVLVSVCLVWPLGCIALARRVLGRDAFTTVVAGLVSGAFPVFPSMLMGWGVLWPNVLGTAVLPGVCALALGHWGLGIGRGGRWGWARLGLIGLVAVVGLGTAHPNAVMSLGIFGLCWALMRTLWRAARRDLPWAWALARIGVGAGLLVGVLVLLPRLSRSVASTSAYVWSDRVTLWEALLQGAAGALQLNHTLAATTLWLACGAAYLLVRRPGTLGVLAAWVASIWLFVLCSWSTEAWTRLLTGYWYNDRVRLAALACVPGVLLLTAGARGLLLIVERVIVAVGGGRAPAGAEMLGAGLLTVAVLVATTEGFNSAERGTLIHRYYHPDHPDQEIVDAADLASLRRLGALLPPDAVVANRPENGSALLWTLAHRRTLFMTIPPLVPPTGADDTRLIGRHLQEVSVRTDVCAALGREGIRYAIDGTRNYWLDSPDIDGGAGNLAGLPGFARIATDGRYTLYRITACG